MSFQVGDEVVCVKIGRGSKYGETLPVVGSHYIVREAEMLLGHRGVAPGIRLREIVNGAHRYRTENGIGVLECAFPESNFRKIDPRAIEIFRAMTRSKTPLVEV